MGKNAAYAAQYAEEAKEQMRMYGIPASEVEKHNEIVQKKGKQNK